MDIEREAHHWRQSGSQNKGPEGKQIAAEEARRERTHAEGGQVPKGEGGLSLRGTSGVLKVENGGNIAVQQLSRAG